MVFLGNFLAVTVLTWVLIGITMHPFGIALLVANVTLLYGLWRLFLYLADMGETIRRKDAE